jgi:hypothetical protein
MRKVIYVLMIATTVWLGIAHVPDVSAQGAPSEAALDRVFQDISVRIGRAVSRVRFDGTWTYEQIIVRDDNLGCANGQRNAPGQTRAWVVRVTVNGFGSYEYRISNDSTLVFFCSGVGVGADAVPPAAAPGSSLPIPPPAGVVASPVTFGAPILAFVGLDGNVYVTSLGSAQGYVPLTGDALGNISEGGYRFARKYYRNLRWSPDGTRLAFTEEGSQTLFVASSGSAPIAIANGLSVEFPPAWSPDGSQIAFAMSGVPSADPNNFTYTIMAAAPTGGPAATIGQIEFGVGCGGGGFGPALMNYFRQAGYNGSEVILKWTPNGFLHTMRCDGTGLALTAFNGTRLWSLPNVSRVRFSPDGFRAVGIAQSLDFRRGSEPVLIDLTSAAVAPLGGAPSADQVGWSSDASTIFIAVRQLIQQATVNPSAPLAASFFALDGQSYRLNLLAMPVTGGPTQLVYESEGYAIAAITPSPTTSLIAFSIVESEAALIGRINANDSYQNVLNAAPRVKIGVAALPLGTPGYPYVIGADGGPPAFSSAASFTAIPAPLMTAPVMPPSGPPLSVPTARPAAPTAVPALRASDGNNPLGLAIGGRAVVPSGAPVIVRSSPRYLADRSNAIGILRPNELVRILAGPIFADNLRWWQVQREIDNFGGWVVDQYIDANGKLETNLQPLR